MTQPGWGLGPWGQQAWGGPAAGTSTTGPTFDGIKFAELVSFNSIRIGWDPATDDTTPSEGILYKVYKVLEGQPINYGAPYTSMYNVLTFTDTNDIVPGQTYCYAVRAQDADGNSDTNTAVLCVTVVISRLDASRMRKTYSFYRQEGQFRPNSTQDTTRFRKTYSFMREKPRLNTR